MADIDKLAKLRKRLLAGDLDLTDQEAYDLAKVDGPGSLAAIEILTRDPDPNIQGNLKGYWQDKGGFGSTAINSFMGEIDSIRKKTPVKAAPGKGLEPTTGTDIKRETYVPTPKTSSASEGSGLDYLRDAKGMQAREKDARLSGRTQRLLRERRFKSNMEELKGLTKFRQEEAKRIGDEKKKWNEARGPKTEDQKEGMLLGRHIRDKSGRLVGHMTTAAGRRALGNINYKGEGVVDNEAPETPEELERWDARPAKMASRAREFKDLWRRSKEQRFDKSGKESSGLTKGERWAALNKSGLDAPRYETSSIETGETFQPEDVSSLKFGTGSGGRGFTGETPFTVSKGSGLGEVTSGSGVTPPPQRDRSPGIQPTSPASGGDTTARLQREQAEREAREKKERAIKARQDKQGAQKLIRSLMPKSLKF